MSSQTAASKQTFTGPMQERRRIRKEAKGSQCAEKRGGDKATSNALGAKSMPRVGFTKIAMWQTRKKQLSRKQPEHQEEMSSAIKMERTQ